ncbi:1-deoxy-D-xylulose-5-phosphate synthase [Agaribacterium haliotis]|uniref:1-deoxy-D-xylulose-5-phosphate synthase n=1 Tax=Agaribacterium haliotis TaxID=2013869 RepID=UPI000BB562AE|nr:1-deoxy-D-xylulose-5-phosphate synthase [Agaribacterium haliotis]
MTELPAQRPPTPLLDRINEPADLKALSEAELETLATELRHFLIYSVSQTGGHFGAGLGVIELTIALHYVLNCPEDDLIWDVGHQAYPHKILTGRRDALNTVRQQHGLAPFPARDESLYDSFGTGHSSTSISAALGMALAKKQQVKQQTEQQQASHSVAVIGDGAMTAGMAFEAINHAAHCKANMLIVLNDNSMSISANEGGLASYLERKMRGLSPVVESSEAPLINSANLFEDLGLNYSGPIDGHNLTLLISRIKKLLKKQGPSLLHIRTQKGRGFAPAVDDPVAYHALTKIESKTKPAPKAKGIKYQDIFGQWLCQKAKEDKRLIAITAAMREGSGLVQFAKTFPERYFDVAIAEQHAMTFAAGLACRGQKPVLAMYSSFLQRAYDQLIHDVALQQLDVTIAIDRAGLVGEDGATHHGSFDLSFLRCIPNLVIAVPSCKQEAQLLLDATYNHQGPAAIRYPRGLAAELDLGSTPAEIGKAHILRQGQQVCILNFGSLLIETIELAKNQNYGLVDMRWLKPLDTECIQNISRDYELIVSLEDGSKAGGAGSAVGEFLHTINSHCKLLTLGYEDRFIEHGKRSELLVQQGLDKTSIKQKILDRLNHR